VTEPDPEVSLSTADRERIVERYRERLLEEPPDDADELRPLVGRLDGDGRFSDVDYDDRSRTSWEPTRVLERVAALARAYRGPDHPLGGDEDVREAAVRALGYWLDHDPESDNWWHNDIGAPRAMREALALSGEWLDADTRAEAAAVLGRVETDGTGANLLWTAEIEFLYGCFADDSERALSAARRAIAEIRITTGEGIQPDYSFHQHGPRFQQFHYGQSFVDTAASFAALVEDTGCAVPAEKRTLLADLVLEGHRRMQRGGVVSPATLDRAVSRPGATCVPATAYRRLAGLVEDRERIGELEAFADHVAAGPPAESAPAAGHRHYWRSEFTVHHRPEWFASLKTVSDRTHNTESINEENLRGRYLTAGALYVARRGDEYHDLFPAWEWTRVPGTTAYADRLTEPDRRAFAGGLATDHAGVYVNDYGVAEGTLEARKAYFFGDGAVACLGAGITADDGAVRTAVAQRRRRGEATAGADGERHALAAGTETTVAADWLHHDGVAYAFPDPTPVTVATPDRTGSWQAINRSRPEEPTTEPVFDAYVGHGERPDGAQYAYVVAPGVDVDAAPGLAADPRVELLENGPARQAVRFSSGRVQAVFHEAGALNAGVDLRAEAPCLVQVEDGTVTVADPGRRHETVRVAVEGATLAVDVSGTPGAPPQGRAELER
jgi:chondroitin AC lyase